MEKSSCELLFQLYPDVSEVKELRSTIITKQFSVLYSHHVEHCNDARDKKNLVVAEDFENIAPESFCF